MSAHDPLPPPDSDPAPVFAWDVNLGFPVDDTAWSEFFARHRVQQSSYIDMEKLTNALKPIHTQPGGKPLQRPAF